MKTMQQYEAFINEVKGLCEKYGIKMVGTCGSESIYGEITLFDASDPSRCGWINPTEHEFNFDYTLDT